MKKFYSKLEKPMEEEEEKSGIFESISQLFN